MTSGPLPITTFLLIKPRAVQRHLPKILKKIVHEGFQIVGFCLEILNKDRADGLLPTDLTVSYVNRGYACQNVGSSKDNCSFIS